MDLLRFYKAYNSKRLFINHNKKVFQNLNKEISHKTLVLVEYNDMTSSHISSSYLANAIAKQNNSDIAAYVPILSKSIWNNRRN